jgi:hypothetical protein
MPADIFIPRENKSNGNTAILGAVGQPRGSMIDPYPDYVLFGEEEKASLIPPAERKCMFCKEKMAVLSVMRVSHCETGEHAGYRYCKTCHTSFSRY